MSNMTETQPRTCKARKGMALVYEFESSSTSVSSGTSRSTSYRLGFVAAATREGAVRKITSERGSGAADVHDTGRRTYGYQPVKRWWMIPELDGRPVPDPRDLHGWQGWTSLDEARAALRPLIVG